MKKIIFTLCILISLTSYSQKKYGEYTSSRGVLKMSSAVVTDKGDTQGSVYLDLNENGKTAMNFALKYSQLVEKLIIADISPKYYAPHHQNILAGLASLDFQVIRSRKGAEEQLSNYISDFGIQQFLLKNLHWLKNGKLGLRINIGVLKNSGEAIGQAVNCDKVFDKPTLFMIGSNSNYIDKIQDY